MEFIRPGIYIDFMRHRKKVVGVSLTLAVLSLISLFYPGPNYGIDFRGGTEVQMAFNGEVEASELRGTLEGLGYVRPDVVRVEGEGNEYIVRVREVTALSEEQMEGLNDRVSGELGDAISVARMEFQPRKKNEELGNYTVFKIVLMLTGEVMSDREAQAEAIQTALENQGINIRDVNPFGSPAENRYEAHLAGLEADLVRQLREELGDRGPDAPTRVEWVGPKAGAQLRDAAVKSLLYAIAFIMVYVALRFDLRFAPGGVLAMIHDALITLGIYVLVQREVNLTTVAALLTIMGYSINDTIVVFDRIRENMGRMRDKSLTELINISTSQMLSRTIVTSLTTLLSVGAFFVWGTAVIKDIAFALMIGILIGTFSSVYVAAPVTEFIDRRFFSRKKS
ncbi:MAG: protein translocase subunit SecF [Myxococcota bacterium]